MCHLAEVGLRDVGGGVKCGALGRRRARRCRLAQRCAVPAAVMLHLLTHLTINYNIENTTSRATLHNRLL